MITTVKYKNTYLKVEESEEGEISVYLPSDPRKTDLQDVMSLDVNKAVISKLNTSSENDLSTEYKNKSVPEGDEEYGAIVHGTPITVVGFSWNEAFRGDFYEPPQSAGFEDYGFYITSDPNKTCLKEILPLYTQEELEDTLIDFMSTRNSFNILDDVY